MQSKLWSARVGFPGILRRAVGAALGLAAVFVAPDTLAKDSQGRPVLVVFPTSTSITEIEALTDRDTGLDLLSTVRNHVITGFDKFKRFHIEKAGTKFPDAKEALINAWVIAMSGAPERIDYGVIPVMTYYRFQQGTETERVGDYVYTYPTMDVELEADVIYIDFSKKEVMTVLKAEATGHMRVEGSETLEQMVADATWFAAEKLAQNIVDRSRRLNEFRLHPKIESDGRIAMGEDFGVEVGDYFYFDPGDASEEGLAVIDEVGAHSSSFQTVGSGSGTMLMEANKEHEQNSNYGILPLAAFLPLRPAFTELDLAPDATTGEVPTPDDVTFGSALEVGISYYELTQGLPFTDPYDANWRELWGWDLSYIHVTQDRFKGGGVNWGFRWGAGYELHLVPPISLSLMPYAGLGMSVGFASIGPEDGDANSILAIPIEIPVGAMVQWYGIGPTMNLFADVSYDIQPWGLFLYDDNGYPDGLPNWGGLMFRAGFMYRGDIGD